MLEYPSFIYLQNHKTGCTFVESCLRRFCTEPLLAYEKHAALQTAPGKFCFTNVREPLALYRSLYTYGLDGKGEVFIRLKQLGLGALYERGPEGFEQWLDFVIRPKNAGALANSYTPAVAKLVGFMSWRFLRLACPGLEQKAQAFNDHKALQDYANANNVLGKVLRQEQLRDDLKKLVCGRLAKAFPDQEAVRKWLDEAPRINVTQTEAPRQPLPDHLLARVLRKEAILYRSFYPVELASLQASLQQPVAGTDP